ncbi:MAG: hypothetical protein IE916_12020, partial [Epsilonproteobacteria bacterium]|nr:hypothetical protein [Campylobacterota bacterium]
VNPSNGQIGGITLNESENNLTYDMGIYNDKTGIIGDTVWFDDNRDGIQDISEEGVYGVKVTLLDSTCTTMLSESVTDEEGTYTFRDLVAGDYCVQFSDLPAGYHISSPHNGEVSGITLSEGQIDLTIDMGIYNDKVGIIGDTVWYDDNRDGIQDSNEEGVYGVKVTLLDATCTTMLQEAVTDEAGTYTFRDLAAGNYCVQFSDTPAGYHISSPHAGEVSGIILGEGAINLDVDMGIYNDKTGIIGDTVWFDDNHDGIQDPTEKGVYGVKVTLLDTTCTTMISEAVTDTAGTYTFRDLTPNSYCVKFSDTPAGYQITSTHAGTVSGVTLTEGEINLTVDMGIYNPKVGSLGDTVWFDDNQNGIQDIAESGVEAVKVTLYQGDCS